MPMSTSMTSRLRQGSAARDALAKALVVSAACCVWLVESAACQTLPARAVSGIETVDSLVSAEFAKDSIGSITVGVIAGSQLAWTRSVGFADMKARRLANRSTVYRIGSITKPFTAVMLMQLVAAGRVQLSDPVERYLKELR
jgi:CubicO group peptidase (beta-lactamase class C family)